MFSESESKILSFWNKNLIFKKSLENSANGPRYIFYDGPPFATGLPHYGHLLASTIKDIIPRYFTMLGYYVERRFGWDCHGLPIEQEIDKQFCMSASDYVKMHGLKNYNASCRSIVNRYTSEWQSTISKLGRWVDFDNDYKTMDPTFMESVWWVFKQMYDKGLIYRGNKIIPYSPTLQTGLSNFEAGQNYQDIQDPAVTVLFPVVDHPNTYFAIWTTTPWTLPSNQGICVNENINYVKVKVDDRIIILAESRLKHYKLNHVLESLSGKILTTYTYTSPISNSICKVYADDYVTDSNGTGIVHLAPAYGEDDNRVMSANGVTEVNDYLDDAGRFVIEPYNGLYFKDAEKQIIKYFSMNNLLFRHDTINHSYPMCPRTDTPLIYRAMPQWYLAASKIKDKLVEVNSQINWVPESIGSNRFGNWLESAKDWAISRNRYWGTPLPIWMNEEGDIICIGSVDELESYSGVRVEDLHRENVDHIKFTTEKGTYTRIPEVLDCWFESGAMPYAQIHYPFENKEVFDNGFPAEFIAEGLDQTRGWFYTLTVLSAALTNKPAFKNVIVNGLVLASDGRKMSKRLKNYTDPNIILDTYGADTLRLYLINSGLTKAEDLRFTDDNLKEVQRTILIPWSNACNFFMMYANEDKYRYKKLDSNNIFDLWIKSRLNYLVTEVNKELSSYRLYTIVPKIIKFIDDLTNWYIRLNRRRFWRDGEDKEYAYSTLYEVLYTFNLLMAPLTPFVTEKFHQEFKNFSEIPESVHLELYPKSIPVDNDLVSMVEQMQEIVNLGRSARIKNNVKIKTPLDSLTIIHCNTEKLDRIKSLEQYIKSELNVKNIYYSTDEDTYVKLEAKTNKPVLGKLLGKQLSNYQSLISNLKTEELKIVENGGVIRVLDYDFGPEHLIISRNAIGNAYTNKLVTITLDFNLTPDLVLEGQARELISSLQSLRKEMKMGVSDKISIEIDCPIEGLLEKFKDYICQEVLIRKLTECKLNNYNWEVKELGIKVLIVS